jgi:hypothetical protein
MKNIILTFSLSVATFFGVLVLLEKNEKVAFEQTLPAVEIRAHSPLKNAPEATIALPEVVIVAKKQKA